VFGARAARVGVAWPVAYAAARAADTVLCSLRRELGYVSGPARQALEAAVRDIT
jgi:hypothetical protein